MTLASKPGCSADCLDTRAEKQAEMSSKRVFGVLFDDIASEAPALR